MRCTQTRQHTYMDTAFPAHRVSISLVSACAQTVSLLPSLSSGREDNPNPNPKIPRASSPNNPPPPSLQNQDLRRGAQKKGKKRHPAFICLAEFRPLTFSPHTESERHQPLHSTRLTSSRRSSDVAEGGQKEERGPRAGATGRGEGRQEKKAGHGPWPEALPPSPIAARLDTTTRYARESEVVVVDSGLLLLLLHGVVWWGAHVAVILAARSMPQGNYGVGRVGHPVLTPRGRAACRCFVCLFHTHFFVLIPRPGVRGADTQESCS